jgi:predicted nucleic acid-binding protein
MNLVDSCGWLEYFADSPLADSVILATARAHGALVRTQDAHFKGLENVRYIEKTNHSV